MHPTRTPIRYPLIAAFLGAAIVLFGAWLRGFDFDERGPDALGIYVLSLYASFAAAIGAYLLHTITHMP